jgi:hypothetical protein
VKRRDLNNLLATMRKMDYIIYDEPYKLNIVGVRNAESQPNKFDDTIYVFYKNDNNNWEFKEYPATTDAGTYWLLNPMSQMGTAMLKEGQYLDAYKQGLHKSKYKALVQNAPVTTYRDYDRNAIFDIGTSETTGNYGINIHKAGEDSQDVNKWSAGCQVFQKSEDFDDFIKLTDKHNELYGNKYTYTLIDERAISRKGRRYLLYGGLFATISAVGITAFILIKRRINK